MTHPTYISAEHTAHAVAKRPVLGSDCQRWCRTPTYVVANPIGVTHPLRLSRELLDPHRPSLGRGSLLYAIFHQLTHRVMSEGELSVALAA